MKDKQSKIYRKKDGTIVIEGAKIIGSTINRCGDYDGSLEPIKDFIRQNFISKEELRKKINKIKETVQKQTGSFKYDSCYDDILNIIK